MGESGVATGLVGGGRGDFDHVVYWCLGPGGATVVNHHIEATVEHGRESNGGIIQGLLLHQPCVTKLSY